MKTNRFIKYFIFAGLSFGLVTLHSCKKSFLEITPKGKVIATKTAEYDLLFNSLDLFNISSDAQIPLGDEVAGLEPFFASGSLRTQRLFKWEDVVYLNGEDAPEMQVPMTSLYLYNTIINEVEGSEEGTVQQKQALKAEAQANRAWTYFLLINYYGKPYNSSSAPSDPGFPIITEGDVTEKNFKRASVQEVYDFIIKDLTAAIPLLPSTYHRTRMSKAAAEGILGKVYMFMGKFDQALPWLNASFTDLSSATVSIRLYNYNTDFLAGGSLTLNPATGLPPLITLPNNLENIFARQVGNNWTTGNNDLMLSPQAGDLYSSGDLRVAFLKDKLSQTSPTTLPAGLKLRRFPSTSQMGFVLPDLYLLRAECKARLNDLSGAEADLEALRQRRMPSAAAEIPSSIAADKVALVKYILEERTREFALLGYRWFDMRRISVEETYSGTINKTHVVYNAIGQPASTYTLRPERLVLRFPQKVMDQNPGMENNP